MRKTIEQTQIIRADSNQTFSNVRASIIEDGRAVKITTTISYDVKEETDNTKSLNEEKKELEKGSEEWLDKYCYVVKASTLSLNDEFLKYIPRTRKQMKFKAELKKVIKAGIDDFRVLNQIEIKIGDRTKVFLGNESPGWWYTQSRELLPAKKSRMVNKKEMIAYLGLRIKNLYENRGYSKSEAWKVICDEANIDWNSTYLVQNEKRKDFLAFGMKGYAPADYTKVSGRGYARDKGRQYGGKTIYVDGRSFVVISV